MKKLFLLLFVAVQFTACYQEDDFTFDPFDDTEFEDEWDDEDYEDDYEDSEEGALTLYRVNGDEIDRIKDYEVSADLKPYQQNYAKHFEMWEFVTRLLPRNSRNKIGEFEIFHGGGDLLGYVMPIDDNDLSNWRFALAIDAVEDLTTIDFTALFTYVTIHEYGHVLTLNDEQVSVSQSESACNNYFTGEGCSSANSYINRLVEIGWLDIINQHDEENPDATYNNYRDRFVTDYAATNPGEDVAEVFSVFVTKENRPTGNSIADQKVNMMYDYPELVRLRSEIRSNGDVRALKSGSWRNDPLFSKFKVCGHRGCKHAQADVHAAVLK